MIWTFINGWPKTSLKRVSRVFIMVLIGLSFTSNRSYAKEDTPSLELLELLGQFEQKDESWFDNELKVEPDIKSKMNSKTQKQINPDRVNQQMNKIIYNLFALIGIALFVLLPIQSRVRADDTDIANGAVSNLSWGSLTPAQQRILKPFSNKWSGLSKQRKQRLLKGVQRWQHMSPTEKKQARKRLKRWRKMDAKQRQRIRNRYERFKKLPLDEQKAIRNRMHWFRSLPKEKRHALRERWREMTPQQRKQFRHRVMERQQRRQKILKRMTPSERKRIRSMSRTERRHLLRRWQARPRH